MGNYLSVICVKKKESKSKIKIFIEKSKISSIDFDHKTPNSKIRKNKSEKSKNFENNPNFSLMKEIMFKQYHKKIDSIEYENYRIKTISNKKLKKQKTKEDFNESAKTKDLKLGLQEIYENLKTSDLYPYKEKCSEKENLILEEKKSEKENLISEKRIDSDFDLCANSWYFAGNQDFQSKKKEIKKINLKNSIKLPEYFSNMKNEILDEKNILKNKTNIRKKNNFEKKQNFKKTNNFENSFQMGNFGNNLKKENFDEKTDVNNTKIINFFEKINMVNNNDFENIFNNEKNKLKVKKLLSESNFSDNFNLKIKGKNQICFLLKKLTNKNLKFFFKKIKITKNFEKVFVNKLVEHNQFKGVSDNTEFSEKSTPENFSKIFSNIFKENSSEKILENIFKENLENNKKEDKISIQILNSEKISLQILESKKNSKNFSKSNFEETSCLKKIISFGENFENLKKEEKCIDDIIENYFNKIIKEIIEEENEIQYSLTKSLFDKLKYSENSVI